MISQVFVLLRSLFMSPAFSSFSPKSIVLSLSTVLFVYIWSRYPALSSKISYFPGITYISYVPSSFVSSSFDPNSSNCSCIVSVFPFSTVPQSIILLTSSDLYILIVALYIPVDSVGSVFMFPFIVPYGFFIVIWYSFLTLVSSAVNSIVICVSSSPILFSMI